MASLEQVFYHLVLPPKVPGKQDTDTQQSNDDILERTVRATRTMGKLAGSQHNSTWKAIRLALRRCALVHALGRLEKQSLIEEFRHLEHGDPLFFYLEEQNAALLIRRNVR